MPILHIRITDNNQIIKLAKGIHAQQMTLKRCVVVKLERGTSTYLYKGGVTLGLDFFRGGIEIASNINNDEISIPFKDNDTVVDTRWNLNFNSEDINQAFQTSVTKYDKTGVAPVFGTGDNELQSIDLYFEYAQLYQYNSY